MSYWRRALIRNWKTVFAVYALAFCSSIVSGFLTVRFAIEPTEDLLKVLVGVIVQLVSFGGIVVAFIYPAQRSTIRRYRHGWLVWNDRLNQFDKNPKKWKVMKRHEIEKVIAAIDWAVTFTRDARIFSLSYFAGAFIALGFDLGLLIFHLAMFHSNTAGLVNSTVVLGSQLLGVEMALVFGGVALLVVGFLKGAIIPEGPVFLNQRGP